MTDRRVEFEVTVRDMVEGAMAGLRGDPALWKRRAACYAYGVTLAVAAVGGLAAAIWDERGALGWLALFVVAFYMAAVFLATAVTLADQYRKAFAQAFRMPTNRRFLGPCAIMLNSAGFHATSPAGDYHHPWVAVYRIRDGRDHAFVCAGMLSYPIPRRAFPSDIAFAEFIGSIRLEMERHQPTSTGR